ncbi:MAG: TetR/AcrR family transcriptional regulator [Pseudochelatococcus sp.]|jgi:AcrR family transcriptional regulator|uniref:TetR/AcrR family transcriptional regulator n=1 Tax=Pseudochelatococcus sp. TaxID=2020869 RepID=UPI003D8C283B
MSVSARQKAPKAPGRPEGGSHARETILKVARDLFADKGYAGTTFKMISEKVGVTNALLTYYFGSKEKLHEEIYLQTAGKIGSMRLQRLAEVTDSGGGLPELLASFIAPLLELVATEDGAAFLRFQWRVESEPPELSFRLRHKAYDESTRAYVKAITAIRPELSEETCFARIACIVGATNYAISSRHRLDILLPGVSQKEGTLHILTELKHNAYKYFL